MPLFFCLKYVGFFLIPFKTVFLIENGLKHCGCFLEKELMCYVNVVTVFSGHDHQASGGAAGREEEEGEQEVHQRGDPHPGQRQ